MFNTLNLTCSPGEKGSSLFPLGELRDGTPIGLPVRVICGASEGPIVSMTGSVHGDEPYGMATINRVFDAVDPADLSGVLIGFPISNPLAVMTKSRIASLDYERLNLNRVFPGNAGGLITERIAAAIFEGGISRANAHLDFHEGGYDFMAEYLIVHTIPEDDATSSASLDLAKAFGMGIPILAMETRPESLRIGFGGTSTIQANTRSVPAMASELGGAGRVWPQYLEMGFEGTLNVLKHLGMIHGPKTEVDREQMISTFSQWPRPTKGGWWTNLVELGQVVEAGEPVGTVRNAFGEVVETLTAPHKSVIFDIRNSAMIMTGEWTVHCGKID